MPVENHMPKDKRKEAMEIFGKHIKGENLIFETEILKKDKRFERFGQCKGLYCYTTRNARIQLSEEIAPCAQKIECIICLLD